MRLKLTLFGGFVLCRGDEEEISIPLAKERALLAYLALNAGKHLTRGHLAGLLWGEQSESRARHSLSQSLSSMCRKLGSAADAVRRERQTVTLQENAIDVDVIAFKSWLASKDADHLRRAVEIYNVNLLSDFDFGEPGFDVWAGGFVSECHDQVMQAGIAYLVGEVEGQEASDRLTVAQRLLRIDPCSETVHQALIRIYIEAGQPGDALRQFEACRQVLREELGIVPSPETERLARDLGRSTPVAIEADPADPLTENPREIPSLAIMPFANLGDDPTITPIASGLTDDITTELTRFGSLFVISRESTFAEQVKLAESTVICRRLGVRHVLRGSLRRAGQDFRANLRLVDGESGRNVWAETYRLNAEDLPDFPQEVVRILVSKLATWLERDFLSRARRKPTISWNAYTHLLQGLEFHHRNWYGIYDTRRAIKHFERAIELDPSCARAYAYLACTKSWPWFKGRRHEQLNPSISLAQHAIELDPTEVEAQRVLGGIHLVRGEHELSKQHFEEARQTHPGHAHVLAHHARYYMHDGAPREAISLLSRARQLNPLHPPWYWEHIGIAQFVNRDYEASLQAFSRMSLHSYYDRLYVASASAHLGLKRHAESYLREALDKRHGLRLSTVAYFLPYRKRDDLSHVLEGLKQAGLPD
jgi:TolB-like protein/two-component SAPR family response regulator